MADMEQEAVRLYELVNPSDMITFAAPSDLVAALAGVVVGGGAYGVERYPAEDRDVLPSCLFGGVEAANEAFAALGCDDWEGALKERAGEIAACLDTFVYGDRQGFLKLMEVVADDQRAEFVRRWNGQRRTSLNNIVGKAYEMAGQLRDQAKTEEVR